MSSRKVMLFLPAAFLAVLMLSTLSSCGSFMRARELANRSKDQAAMRNVLKACMIYASDNRDIMPPHLAVLVANGMISPSDLVSASKKTTPSTAGPTKDWRSIAADIDAHCDWIYIGGNLLNSGDSTIPVLYSKDIYASHEGRNVGYLDTHTEFVKTAAFTPQLVPLNELRAKKGLPPVTLDRQPAP